MDGPRTPEISEPKPNRVAGLRQRVINKLKGIPDVDPSTLHPAVFEAPEREVDIVNGKEYLISLSPGEAAYEFEQAEWSKWLSEHVEEFKNESKDTKANAGILMKEFVAGINDMYHEHLARGNKFPRRPMVRIRAANYGSDSAGSGNAGIWIGKNYLLDFARKPLDMPEETKSPYKDKDVIQFNGSPRQMLRLTGVHECDHQQNEQEHPDREITFSQGGELTQAQYDAKPHELRAKKEELSYAKQHNYPERTVAILRDRIAAAEKFQEFMTKHTVIVARAGDSN